MSFVEQIARTRRQDSRDEATAEALKARAGESQRREQVRGQNRALWAAHHAQLAEVFAELSDDHARRARALA